MKRKIILLLATALYFPVLLFARARVQGTCSQGGNRVLVANGAAASSTTAGVETDWVQSFKNCTVTVYAAGTTTLSTIFADNSGGVKANPFTADSSGQWFFYAANGRYDVKLSSGGIATAFVLGDLAASDFTDNPLPVTSGGTGTGTGSITAPGALNFLAGGTDQSITLTPSGTGKVNITTALAKSLNNIYFASQFLGADIFAQCNAALLAVGANGQVIIEPGTYNSVATTLAPTAENQVIQMNGANINYTGTGTAIQMAFQSANNSSRFVIIGYGSVLNGPGTANTIGVAWGLPGTTGNHQSLFGLKIKNFDVGVKIQNSLYGAAYDVQAAANKTINWWWSPATAPGLVAIQFECFNCRGQGNDTANTAKVTKTNVQVSGNEVHWWGGDIEGAVNQNVAIYGGNLNTFLETHIEGFGAAASLGTVSFTNGSTAIVGTATTFTNVVDADGITGQGSLAGKYVKLNADSAFRLMRVLSVTDNTHATLTDAYQGVTSNAAASWSDGNILIINTTDGSAAGSSTSLGTGNNFSLTPSGAAAMGVYIQSGGTNTFLAPSTMNVPVTIGANTGGALPSNNLILGNLFAASMATDLALSGLNFWRGTVPGSTQNSFAASSRSIITNLLSGQIPLKVQGVAGQAVDLMRISDSTDAALLTVSSVGNITGGSGGGSFQITPSTLSNGNLNLNLAAGKMVFGAGDLGNAGNRWTNIFSGKEDIGTGIAQSGGFKHQRFGATTATAATAGATSTTTYSWTTAFADASYTATCVGVSPTGTPSGDINAVQTAASIVFRVTAITAVASSYAAVDCIAVHD